MGGEGLGSGQTAEGGRYLDDLVVIDADLRSKPEAFKGRDPNKGWA